MVFLYVKIPPTDLFLAHRGSEKFAPRSPATREQAAKMLALLYRFMNEK
jgi:hypothetical protein